MARGLFLSKFSNVISALLRLLGRHQGSKILSQPFLLAPRLKNLPSFDQSRRECDGLMSVREKQQQIVNREV